MLDWITNLMNSAGYGAVVFLMFIENVFPPIPSELIMPMAGFTVTQGQMIFIGVVIAGTLGSVLGALPLYYAGKWVGQERLQAWADRHYRWLTVSSKDLARSRHWFDRHGGKAVFLCRLVPGIRSLISIPAGINNMNMGSFLLYTSLGSGVWSTLLAYAGLKLGENYTRVDEYVGPISYVVLGGLLLVYIVRVIRHGKASGGRTEMAGGKSR